MDNFKIEIIDKIILAWLEEKDLTKDKFHKVKNEIYKTYKLPKAIATIEIIERYNNLFENEEFVGMISNRTTNIENIIGRIDYIYNDVYGG